MTESAFVMDGARVAAPAGLRVRTYLEDPSLAFRGSPRRKTVNELVIHETVTRDVPSTLRILRRRKLGTHFVVAPDGEVLQLADPVLVRLEHAAPHNVRSVGVEIVNPVEPRLLRKNLPWRRSIKAKWASGGAYVLPTPAQAEANAALIDALTKGTIAGLEVPRTWCGLDQGRLAMGRVKGAKAARPGIYAHCNFHHADGAWPGLYAWLRLEAGLSAEVAFERAVDLASGIERNVDLGSLLAAAA